jgi:putative iron-regulated protein
VATGYHAIEFLLWGQDLNGTGPGAGNRPYTDYDTKVCTGGHCDRRAAYLKTAAALLVSDLQEMAANWARDGAAREELAAKGVDGGLVTILTGLGSLSYGELAGERMKLGLILHDPEEEHDCFSDNTHNSHYYDEVGMYGIYTGKYTGIDGKVLSGASLADYAAAKAAEANKKLDADFQATLAAMKVLKDTADSGKMASASRSRSKAPTASTTRRPSSPSNRQSDRVGEGGELLSDAAHLSAPGGSAFREGRTRAERCAAAA